jgi:hypothetical protein
VPDQGQPRAAQTASPKIFRSAGKRFGSEFGVTCELTETVAAGQ